MAKRTSVFDDPTMEIQELTALIKQDITTLNSAVVDLQLLCNSRNENGNISSDTSSHSTTVVDDLKNRLMSTTKEFKEVLTMRTEVSPNVSLQFSFLEFAFIHLSDSLLQLFFSFSFLKILTLFVGLMKNLKVHENRRQLFSSTASKESTNPFVRQRPLASRSAAGAPSAPPPPWAKASTSFSKTSPG